MAKKKEQQLVVNQVIVHPVHRQRVDVGKWRTAILAADRGRMGQLYDLYEDLLLDGVLADAIDKRIRAVTGADLTFQNAEGEENDEVISLIDTDEFEFLLQEIMQGLFWGVSLLELTFDPENGMAVYSVPRKHIRPDTKRIAIQQNDPEGAIDYEGMPNMIEVVNRKDKLGVIIRACPYAIFKRGGFSDWAQMVEIFGMPKRVGKYSIYDVEARKQLEEAFNSQGAAATLIVPKETEVSTESGGGSTNSSLYLDFVEACDRQILISILSQTMTTMDGSSRSQSETHKEVEEELNKQDLRMVQRVLNKKLMPILEARGYPVSGGSFVFPKVLENLSIDKLISLSEVLEIPAYYFQDRYGIPQAEEGDKLARREEKPTLPVGSGNRKGEELMESHRFFSVAPTEGSGAKSGRSWIGYMADTAINLADRINFGVNINRLFARALEEIYREQGAELVDRSLFEITNTALQKGVDKSFKKAGVEFGKRNEAFIEEFKKNTAVFSAFKAHREGNDIAAMLLDENGDLRSFHEFKKAVLGSSIDRDYNRNWLRTEYNMAVRAARSAAYYRECLETAHLYPNLEYLESSAANKRKDHKEYVGTVLPIEHPWWDTHMPPSAWGCECGVRKTDKPVTPVPQDGQPVNPVFDNNPGKTAEFVKMKEHPYIKGVCPYFATCKRRTNGFSLLKLADSDENPPIIPQCAICKLAQSYIFNLQRIKKNEALFKKLKENSNYFNVHFNAKNGGLKATHIEHNFDPKKGYREKRVQDIGFKYGASVILESERGKPIGHKYTEGLWNGKKFEIASAENGTDVNVRNALKHCASKKETEIAVINFVDDFNKVAFFRGLARYNGLKGAPGSQYKEFDKIICIYDGKIVYTK